MRRPFTICASMLLTVALAPAALFAQDPGRRRAPAQASGAAEPEARVYDRRRPPARSRSRPDQTAVFEELLAKLSAGAGQGEDAALKAAVRELQGLQDLRSRWARTRLYVVARRSRAGQGASTSSSQVVAEGDDAGRAAGARDPGDVQEGRRRLRRAVQQAEPDARQVGRQPHRGSPQGQRLDPVVVHLPTQNFRFTPA